VKLGLQIPTYEWASGHDTLGDDLARLVRQAEDAGFATISVADHLLQAPMVAPPESEMLEAYSTLAFVAAHTRTVDLLTIVTGVTLRHPGVLAKTVTTLDVLSGGRAWLGIGAAWFDDEHRAFGVPFPPLGERFERLEEAVQICLQLWRGDEQPFAGRHYRLGRPVNCPQVLSRPGRPRPPLMIGGDGERKTLRLVARYADACNFNVQGDAPTAAHKLDVLRRHCDAEDRDYDAIEKTCMIRYQLDGGDPGLLVERLRALADVGIQRVFGPIRGVDWPRGIDLMHDHVIPALRDA
jgi:F420-dependent oxidoreductase-like protein